MGQAQTEHGQGLHGARAVIPASTGAALWRWLRARAGALWWGVGVVAALAIIAISVMLTKHAVSRDEGAYIIIARGILHGHVPYRDYFDQPGPGIYYLVAALLACTSWLSSVHQIEAIFVFVDLMNLVTAVGIVLLGSKLWRLEVGVLAAALWLVVLPVYLGNYILLEPLATTLCVWSVVAALWTVSSERLRGSRLVRLLEPLGLAALLAGVILAFASIFRQTALLELPGVVVVLWARAGTWRERLRAGLIAVVGFCLPWLIVCALFALGGGFGALLNDVVWINLTHYPAAQRVDIITPIRMFADYMPLVWEVALGALVGFAGWALFARRRPHAGVVACYLLALFGWLPVLLHNFNHYWLQPLPWVCLLTSLAICWGARQVLALARVRVDLATSRSVALVAVLGVAIALPVGHSIMAQRAASSARLNVQVSEAAWLNALVPPNATLLVGPAEPELYFLADRMPLPNYVYLLPINNSDNARAAADVQAGRYQYIAWVLSDLGRVPHSHMLTDVHSTQYAQINKQIQLHYHPIAYFAGLPGEGGNQCALYQLNALSTVTP